MNNFFPRLIIFIIAISALYLFFDDAERDDTGAIVSEGDLGVMSLRLGDCLNDPNISEADEAEAVSSVSAIPCDQPHDFEVYAESDQLFYRQSVRPDEEEILERANRFCGVEFENFVGVNLQSSIFTYYYFYPTKKSWNQGDRTISCLLGHYLGTKLEGSKRGSKI